MADNSKKVKKGVYVVFRDQYLKITVFGKNKDTNFTHINGLFFLPCLKKASSKTSGFVVKPDVFPEFYLISSLFCLHIQLNRKVLLKANTTINLVSECQQRKIVM